MKKISLLFILLCVQGNLFSIGVKTLDTTLVGTDKSQFIDTIWTFTSADDYAKGFVSFKGGISLLSTGSTYTVDVGITGEVDTPIFLGGNTLRLTNDLQLGNLVRISGPGWIDLNGNVLQVGSSMQMQASTVYMFTSLAGGTIKGNNSFVRNFAPLFVGSTSLLANTVTIDSLTFIIDSPFVLITQAAAAYFFKEVSFVITPGITFDLYGSWSSLENTFVKFIGQGGTVLSHITSSIGPILNGSSYFEIGKGVTYVADGTFSVDGSNARFILDNSSLISNGVAFKFTDGDINLDVIGNCNILSQNNGTMQFFGGDVINVFPGSTLSVDGNLLVQLGS